MATIVDCKIDASWNDSLESYREANSSIEILCRRQKFDRTMRKVKAIEFIIFVKSKRIVRLLFELLELKSNESFHDETKKKQCRNIYTRPERICFGHLTSPEIFLLHLDIFF